MPSSTAARAVSYTHLFGLLRTGDTLFSVSGDPYDTLLDVISGDGIGSLADYGVRFKKCELKEDGSFDYGSICAGLKLSLIHISP